MTPARSNVVLLVFSVLCLLFGVVGWLQDSAPAGPSTDVPSNDTLSAVPPASRQEASQSSAPADAPQQARQSLAEDSAPQPLTPLPQGRIHGSALDRHGNPVAGARIVAVSASKSALTRPNWAAGPEQVAAYLDKLAAEARTRAHHVQTGADGRFEIAGLDPTGRYELHGASDKHGDTVRYGAVCGAETELVFSGIGVVVARLTYPDGSPVTVANVVTKWINHWGQNEQVAVDGVHRLTIREEVVSVRLSAPRFLPTRPITPDEVGTEVALVLEPGLVLGGVVRDPAGSAIGNARVTLRPVSDLAGQPADRDTFYTSSSESTDALGRFEFPALRAGVYSLVAQLGWADAVSPVVQEIRLEDSATVELQLETGARVTIEALDAQQQPINGVSVDFADLNGKEIEPMSLESRPGRRVYIGLPAAQLLATVRARDYGNQTLRIDTTSGSADASVTLQKGAYLSGRLVDETGRVVSGLRIRLTQAGVDPGQAANDWEYASDGEYSIGPLQPGAWILDVYFDELMAEKVGTHTLQLAPGRHEQDLTVKPPRGLHVVVASAQGLRGDDCTLYLRNADNEQEHYIDLNTGKGELFLAVPAGSYTVHAANETSVSRTHTAALGVGLVRLELVLEAPDCVRLAAVESGSNAAINGLLAGDLVVEYDNQPVRNLSDLLRLTKLADGREGVSITVLRAGEPRTMKVNGGFLGVGVELGKR